MAAPRRSIGKILKDDAHFFKKTRRASGPGHLAVGALADCIVIDLDRLDRDAILTVDLLDLPFARGNASHVAESIVAGRSIVKDGTVRDIDLKTLETELRDRYRAEVPRFSEFQDAWPRIEAAVSGWFENQSGRGC